MAEAAAGRGACFAGIWSIEVAGSLEDFLISRIAANRAFSRCSGAASR
jgi:hypothetical protein